MKKILVGFLVLMTTFVSCTDQEDIEIAYQTDMSITASHIFDSYTTVLGDEFKMKGTQYGDWELNLHAFIYNNDGILVEKIEENFSSLTASLDFNLDLLPGKYSIIAVADFEGNLNGHSYKFWNIENTSNGNKLIDLNIQESENICNSPFETLGILSNNFEIGNRGENIVIDIKPVTGLLQSIIWDTDMTGNGMNGFSSYAQYFESIEIFAPDLKQIVKFDGINPKYEFGAQTIRYQIQAHSPKAQFEKGGATEVLAFRALLPIEERDFFWEGHVTEGMGKYLFKDGKDFQTSDMTDKINIESGKQYVMDLLLDGLCLFVDDYDPDKDMFERIQKHINSLNEKAFNQIMDRNFDTFIGLSQSTIEATFGKDGYISDGTLYYFDYNQYVSNLVFGFDTATNKTNTINLIFQNLNDDFRDRMIKYLTNRFTIFEKGTDAHTKAFINGSNLDSSSIGITWDLDQDILTYVQLK